MDIIVVTYHRCKRNDNINMTTHSSLSASCCLVNKTGSLSSTSTDFASPTWAAAMVKRNRRWVNFMLQVEVDWSYEHVGFDLCAENYINRILDVIWYFPLLDDIALLNHLVKSSKKICGWYCTLESSCKEFEKVWRSREEAPWTSSSMVQKSTFDAFHLIGIHSYFQDISNPFSCRKPAVAPWSYIRILKTIETHRYLFLSF